MPLFPHFSEKCICTKKMHFFESRKKRKRFLCVCCIINYHSILAPFSSLHCKIINQKKNFFSLFARKLAQGIFFIFHFMIRISVGNGKIFLSRFIIQRQQLKLSPTDNENQYVYILKKKYI